MWDLKALTTLSSTWLLCKIYKYLYMPSLAVSRLLRLRLFLQRTVKSQSLSRSLRSQIIIWSFDSLHNSCQVCVWSLIEFLFSFFFSFLCDTFQILLLFIEVWKFSNFIRNIIQFLGLDNWLWKFPWFWDIYWIQTFEMFLIWKFSRRLKLEIMP